MEADTEQPSSPGLKPLPPPRGSPAWIFKEPKEFYLQRERQAEREARKTQRLETRRALQEQGHTVALHRPTIKNTIDADPPVPFSKIRPPLTAVWAPPPFTENTPPTKAKVESTRKKISTEADTTLKLEDDQRATIGGQKARLTKEMWNTLRGWSRGHTGSPWTLKQVCAEIEADIQHRTAKDTRKPGKMGPDELGPASQQGTRRMVAFERTFERNYSMASASDAFSANNSGAGPASISPSGSLAGTGKLQKSISLPALTQNEEAAPAQRTKTSHF